MSNFSTKGIDTSKKGKLSQYITCGGPQKLKINSLTIEAAKTGSKRIVFHMETEPIKAGGFTGVDNAQGQVGKVRTGYMKTEDQEKEVLTNLGIIGDKLGVRAEIDAIQSDNIEDYVQQVEKLITGKYLYWVIRGEEYPKPDNTLGLSLQFRRFGFVASLEEGADHLKPFDKTSSYDFIVYKAPVANDMPF